MTLERFWQHWHNFWFRPASPEPLALFRIFFGVLVLQVLLISLGGDFLTWYGKHSIVGAETVRLNYWNKEPHFDLLLLFGNDDTRLQIYFVTVIVAAVCLTVGYKTKLAAAYVCLALISLHNHNPFNINGGDAFLRLTSIFLSFSNAGDCYSIDRWLERRRNPKAPVPLKAPWAQRMIQIQLALVYWQTSWLKLSGSQWLDGTAVYYATRLEDLMRFPMPMFNSLLFCKLLSWYTLVVEFLMWTLVWIKELRYPILISALVLHLGIDYAINLPVFEWAFIFALVTFIEPEDVRRWMTNGLGWVASRARAFSDRAVERHLPEHSQAELSD